MRILFQQVLYFLTELEYENVLTNFFIITEFHYGKVILLYPIVRISHRNLQIFYHKFSISKEF